ncbi:MAG: ABC transporter permease [Clostridiaceae bacterium]|nr:ABC transporter permease [Clostridiaceae bacterium]
MKLIDFFDANLLNSLLRYITPVLLATMGGLLCDQVGIMNIALEGFMLLGTFIAVWFSFISQSATIGVLAAILVTMLLAYFFGLFSITLKGNKIVLGIAFNLFCSGVTVYLLTTLFHTRGSFISPKIVGLPNFPIKAIENMPIIGSLFSNHTLVIYISLLILILITILLYKHKVGLRLRGIGEHAAAAQSLGVNVKFYQFAIVILSGALCGLAGAQLSLGNVRLFVEGMSAGRGWIAVAAVMLAQGNPLIAFAACFIFGFSDAISGRLQGIGIPVEFAQSFPYILTVISLIIIHYRKKKRSSVYESL